MLPGFSDPTVFSSSEPEGSMYSKFDIKYVGKRRLVKKGEVYCGLSEHLAHELLKVLEQFQITDTFFICQAVGLGLVGKMHYK